MRYALADFSPIFLSSISCKHLVLSSLEFSSSSLSRRCTPTSQGSVPSLPDEAVRCLCAQIVLSWGRVDDSCVFVEFLDQDNLPLHCEKTCCWTTIRMQKATSEKHRITNHYTGIIV